MPTALRIVDPLDPTTVYVDLNFLSTNEQAQEGFLLIDDGFDLGGVETDTNFLEQSPYPGGVVLESRHPVAVMSLAVMAKSTSFDALRIMVGELHKRLQHGGALEWTPENGETRYIDFYPSPIPALMRDDDDNYLHTVGQFFDPGFEIRIARHPYLRGRPGNPIVLSFSNDASGREQEIDVPGTAPSLSKVTIIPGGSPSPKTVEYRLSRRSRGVLANLSTVYGSEAEAMTLGAATTSINDSETGRSVARVNFTSSPWLRRRLRRVLTVPNARDLEGRYKVYAVLRATAAGVFGIQSRWSDGNRDPVDVTNSIVQFDTSDLTRFTSYVEVDLGSVSPTSNSLTVEVWAKREDGAGDLYFDQVFLVPIDEFRSTYSVPGHRGGGGGRTSYHGRELDNVSGAAANKNDDRILNAVGDEVASPGGFEVLTAGRYEIEVEVTLRNKNEGKAILGYLEVRDGTNAIVDSVALQGKKGQLHTKRTKRVHFDANGATAYRFHVRLTNAPSGSDARITVHRLHVSSQRFVSNSDRVILDGHRRDAYVEVAASGRASKMLVHGGFLELAPGKNLLFLQATDVISSGYDDVVEKEPLARSESGRTSSVTVEVIPRYLT